MLGQMSLEDIRVSQDVYGAVDCCISRQSHCLSKVRSHSLGKRGFSISHNEVLFRSVFSVRKYRCRLGGPQQQVSSANFERSELYFIEKLIGFVQTREELSIALLKSIKLQELTKLELTHIYSEPQIAPIKPCFEAKILYSLLSKVRARPLTNRDREAKKHYIVFFVNRAPVC